MAWWEHHVQEHFWGCDPKRFGKPSRETVDVTRTDKVGSSLAAASDVAVRCLIGNVKETKLKVSDGKAGEWECAASRSASSQGGTQGLLAAVCWQGSQHPYWLEGDASSGNGQRKRRLTRGVKPRGRQKVMG